MPNIIFYCFTIFMAAICYILKSACIATDGMPAKKRARSLTNINGGGGGKLTIPAGNYADGVWVCGNVLAHIGQNIISKNQFRYHCDQQIFRFQFQTSEVKI
jgi:hypothetical protein